MDGPTPVHRRSRIASIDDRLISKRARQAAHVWNTGNRCSSRSSHLLNHADDDEIVHRIDPEPRPRGAAPPETPFTVVTTGGNWIGVHGKLQSETGAGRENRQIRRQ